MNEGDTQGTVFLSTRRGEVGTAETALLSSRRIEGVLKKRVYCPEY
jgi:hypothetical protein